MSDSARVLIEFASADDASANICAADLLTTLREHAPNVQAQQIKDHRRLHTQDAGTILSIVLSSSAIASVAVGIGTWISRNSGARLIIRPDGSTEATNLNSADVAAIAAALRK